MVENPGPPTNGLPWSDGPTASRAVWDAACHGSRPEHSGHAMHRQKLGAPWTRLAIMELLQRGHSGVGWSPGWPGVYCIGKSECEAVELPLTVIWLVAATRMK